jgi:hypothetical protein
MAQSTEQQPASEQPTSNKTDLSDGRLTYIMLALNMASVIAAIAGAFLVNDLIFWVIIVFLLVAAVVILYQAHRRFAHRDFIRWGGITAAIFVAIFLIRVLMAAPIFEINVLNTNQKTSSVFGIQLPPWKADVFEITNHLINAKNELDQGQVAYDFQDASLHLEIIPLHYGTRSYSNLVLQLSGSSGETKEIPLWDVFDSSTKAISNLPISIKDIVEVSGIQYTTANNTFNLPLTEKDIPKAALNLKIIRKANPGHALGQRKIEIVNTPWVQLTKLDRRDGTHVVDYYLKNLGTPGKFGYQVVVTRVIYPVNESRSPLWGGTDLTAPYQSSDIFDLARGEEHRETILLDSSLPRGRYVVSIYTFKIPINIQHTLTNWEDWKDYHTAWMAAGQADNYPFIMCEDAGKSCEESAAYPVEKYSPLVSGYNTSENGSDFLDTQPYLAEDHFSNRYIFYYTRVQEESGNAGVELYFERPVNLNPKPEFNLRKLRFRLKMERQIPVVGTLVSGDANKGQSVAYAQVVVGEGSAYGQATDEEQEIVIPISAFSGVDKTNISEIDFDVNLSKVPDQAEHSFTVSQIEFVDMRP